MRLHQDTQVLLHVATRERRQQQRHKFCSQKAQWPRRCDALGEDAVHKGQIERYILADPTQMTAYCHLSHHYGQVSIKRSCCRYSALRPVVTWHMHHISKLYAAVLCQLWNPSCCPGAIYMWRQRQSTQECCARSSLHTILFRQDCSHQVLPNSAGSVRCSA